jgi:hypothetical protein
LSIENLHVSAPPAELPPVHYEDIHVSVQRSPIVADGSYQAVLKFVSDQREVTASGRTLNIREQVQRLHFSREGREGALSAHPDFTAQLKKLGLMVYDSIFKEPVRRDLLSMLYSSRNVRLHWLGDPSDAASSALPWESLFVPSAPVSFLALTRKYSLMRRYAEAKSMPVSLIGQTVRILFVTASHRWWHPFPESRRRSRPCVGYSTPLDGPIFRSSKTRRLKSCKKRCVSLGLTFSRRSQPVNATLYLKRKRWSVW